MQTPLLRLKAPHTNSPKRMPYILKKLVERIRLKIKAFSLWSYFLWILITHYLDDVWILLGENWSWLLGNLKLIGHFFGPKGMSRFSCTCFHVYVACAASVSVWFLGKERPRNDKAWDVLFWRPKNGMRAFLLAQFFGQSLTLVPYSLLQNHTERIAMQANV